MYAMREHTCENYESCIKNEKLCIKNEEFSIINHEFGRNFTEEAIQNWGESQFFKSIDSQWPQFATVGGIGGWAGVAAVGEGMRIEVGSVRWRTEGWAALRATGANASVTTIPIAVTAGSACNSSSTVELLDATGARFPGYSGESAAPLVFGTSRGLPPAINTSTGIAFRVSYGSGELFGISLRCVPKRVGEGRYVLMK